MQLLISIIHISSFSSDDLAENHVSIPSERAIDVLIYFCSDVKVRQQNNLIYIIILVSKYDLDFLRFLFQNFILEKMPQVNNKHDHSISRGDRSRSTNHSNKKNYPKIDRHILVGQQQRSFEERQRSPASPRRQKHQNEQRCKQCESFHRKIKEREQHFKKIVSIYHEEIDKLKQINESLREQLEELFEKQQQTRKEAEELRQQRQECSNMKSVIIKDSQERHKRKKELQFCISPIEKGREPIIIQRLSQKILSELQSPTFSRLLAGTPQVSKIDQPECVNEAQKQNALRAEFDRLMTECEQASNRSKKTTLRKQMASIANQLALIGKV